MSKYRKKFNDDKWILHNEEGASSCRSWKRLAKVFDRENVIFLEEQSVAGWSSSLSPCSKGCKSEAVDVLDTEENLCEYRPTAYDLNAATAIGLKLIRLCCMAQFLQMSPLYLNRGTNMNKLGWISDEPVNRVLVQPLQNDEWHRCGCTALTVLPSIM